MKEWTTKPQLTWLKEKVPGWYQAQGEKRVREFLDNLILRFYEKFSIPASQWAVHDKVSLPFQPPRSDDTNLNPANQEVVL